MNQERFSSFVETAVNHAHIAEFVVAIPAIFINLFHLCILLNASMRTSSTNSILIGIAISDLVVLAVVLYDRVMQFWFTKTLDCNQITGEIQWIHDLQRDILEQTSFWLGVFLAFNRLLIMKLPQKYQWVSNPICGYFVVLGLFTLSIVLSALFYFLVHFNAFVKIPGSECSEASDDLVERLVTLELVSGSSQILISLIYPILAVFLITLIKKSTTNEAAQSKKSTIERHRSAKMILIMTMLYVICSAPCGIMDFLQLFIHENTFLEVLATYGSTFVALFFCLNSISHCLLSFAMSSKYRETAKSIWRTAKIRDTVLVKPSGDQK